jgi:phiKZ-like phage internal head proteins
MRGLVFAMENDEVSQSATDDEAIAQSSADLEAASSQVATEAQEIAQLVEDTDTAVADVGTLEKVQDVVAQTVQSGQGIGQNTAQVAQVVVESICSRLGIPVSRRLMPAAEAFGSTNTRLAATKVALENAFTDTIKRIWEAIKRAIKTTWTKIKEFFLKFFDNTDKVIKHANALKIKAKERIGWKADKNKLEMPGLIKTLGGNIEGAEKGGFVALENHMALTQLGDGFIKGVEGLVGTIKQAVEHLTGAGKDVAEGNVGKLADAMEKLMFGWKSANMKSIPSTTETEGGKTIKKMFYGPFIDSQCITITEITSTHTVNGSDVTSVSVRYSFEPMKVKDEAKELPVFSLSLVDSLCDRIIAMMKNTEDFKKSNGQINKIGTGLLDVADGVLKTAEGLVGQNSTVAAYRTVVADLSSWFSKYVTLTPAINVRLANALLKYINAVINVHKERT